VARPNNYRWLLPVGILCVLLTGCLPAEAAGLKWVAVLELRNGAGLKERDVARLSETVRGEAGRVLPADQFTVMTKDGVRDLLKDKARLTGPCDSECELEQGLAISADYLIAGDVALDGGTLRVSLRLYETATGNRLNTVTLVGRIVAELESPLAEAATGLLAALSGGTTSPAKPEDVAVSVAATPTPDPTPIPTRPPAPAGVTPSSTAHFLRTACGSIVDTYTHLEWYEGPDRDTTWQDAREWAQRLTACGGGWRMPTTDELARLWHKGAGERNMDPTFQTSGWYVWAADSGFSFYVGGERRRDPDDAGGKRGFAVRMYRP
jgi:hypothetical protein